MLDPALQERYMAVLENQAIEQKRLFRALATRVERADYSRLSAQLKSAVGARARILDDELSILSRRIRTRQRCRDAVQNGKRQLALKLRKENQRWTRQLRAVRRVLCGLGLGEVWFTISDSVATLVADLDQIPEFDERFELVARKLPTVLKSADRVRLRKTVYWAVEVPAHLIDEKLAPVAARATSRRKAEP